MEPTLDKSEILRRFAVVLKQLSSRRYPLAISADIQTDDPVRLDAQNGKTSAESAILIGERDRWEGDLLVGIRLSDLHLNDDFVWSISPLLHERGELVDLLGDILVWSHLEAFERFSTLVAPSSWEAGCLKWRHRKYGLDLVPEENKQPPQLLFRFHASVVIWAFNARLQQLAEEGGSGAY